MVRVAIPKAYVDCKSRTRNRLLYDVLTADQFNRLSLIASTTGCEEHCGSAMGCMYLVRELLPWCSPLGRLYIPCPALSVQGPDADALFFTGEFLGHYVIVESTQALTVLMGLVVLEPCTPRTGPLQQLDPPCDVQPASTRVNT